jgi:hypothetical protein
MFDCKGTKKRAINITNGGKKEICINLNRINYIENSDGKINIFFGSHSVVLELEDEERESVFNRLCYALKDD